MWWKEAEGGEEKSSLTVLRVLKRRHTAPDKDAEGPSVEEEGDGHALVDPDVHGERELGLLSQVLFEVEAARVAESLGL